MTPEGRIKEGVKDLLKQYGAYYHMVVMNGMGKPSLDFIGCYHGRFFAIETKAGDKTMTPKQTITAVEMAAAGGKVFLINAETGVAELEAWLAAVVDSR